MHNHKAGFITGIQRQCNIRKPMNIAHHLNVFKSKHQIITAIDAEKAVGKIQQGAGMQPFLIKSLEKTVMCGYLTV